MTASSAGAVVRVPFPYTDRATRQHRPALVISGNPPGEGGRLLWVLMITSAENRAWPGDVAIADHASVGLPSPSVIRTAKIMTIEATEAEWRGTIDANLLASVRTAVSHTLGWTAP